MSDEKVYGIVERNEHGRVIVRPLGLPTLLPGAMVEIREIDEAPTPDKPIPYRITPAGHAMLPA